MPQGFAFSVARTTSGQARYRQRNFVPGYSCRNVSATWVFAAAISHQRHFPSRASREVMMLVTSARVAVTAGGAGDLAAWPAT
jgi:hypothetical protein